MKISCIRLYGCNGVNTGKIASFLTETFGVQCITSHLAYDTGMADSCAIGDIYKPHRLHDVITPIMYNGHKLYDGYHLLDIMGDAILYDHGTFHIVFTNLLACTYDDSDKRYHARSMISANPSVISIPGIIEAPAKSREYYVDLMINSTDMAKYDGQFLTCDDHHTLEQVMCGYCMQSIFYYECGEAFCSDKNCRLYNAHWQADLLHSQIESGVLCAHHDALLQRMKSTIK